MLKKQEIWRITTVSSWEEIMRTKIFLSLFLATMMCVASFSTVFAGEKPAVTNDTENENVIYEALENVKEQNRKDIIEDLMFTEVCYVYTIDGDESNFERPQVDSVKLINNLANLSDKDFEEEIKNIVDDTLSINKDKNNILWDINFKNNLIDKFAPQYRKVLNTESVTMTAPLMTRAYNTTTKPAYVTAEAFGNKLYKFGCDVTYSWGDGKLQSVSPYTYGKSYVSRYTYEGLSYAPPVEMDSLSAVIVREGHFKETLANMDFRHAYPILSMTCNNKGEFSFIGRKDNKN